MTRLLTRLDEPTRAWLYRIALAVIALLVAYGVVSEGEAAQWALLIAAVLGIGEGALATANTTTRRRDP